MRALLALALILCAGNAWGHGDAQWIADGHYTAENGASCCGESDCHRIDDERLLKRTAEGWEIRGASFPDSQHGHGLYASERPDPYWCEWGGKVRCLFVIPEGS